MEDNGTPELALRLIEENKRTKDPYLDLGNCGLIVLPKELEECIWVETLSLSHAWRQYEPELDSWVVWRSTNEGKRNYIFSLSGIEELQKLKRLIVAGTHLITNLKPLSKLFSLQEINFSTTGISDLSPLSNLTSLETINGNNTPVSDLSSLSSLPNLKILSFSNTNVTRLQPLKSLVSLESFEFNYSQIEDCPADVYESMNGAILRSFFQREAEEEKTKSQKSIEKAIVEAVEQGQRHHDVKLILLGNSDAGKTSLLHYLKTGEFLTDRNSTHGLEVHRWLPDKKRFPSLSNVAVSIWDFGGQEYYHDAYRLFMSANAAYMMLWDTETNCNGRRPTCLKSGEKEEDLEHFEVSYWLDTVCYYCGDPNRSPLMVVQNKTDKSGKHRLSQDLHNEYVIDESFHISLKCGCDDNEANHPRERSVLRHFDAELEHALLSMVDKTGLPDAWLKVRSSLLDLQEGKGTKKNPFAKKLQEDGSITLADFTACCSELLKEKIKEDEARSIATTLERGGVLVYFKDSEILKDRVFLKPANLAERIYDILKTDVLKLGGEFTLAQIFDENDDEDFQQTFIEATQNLGLVFPHPNPKSTNEKAYIAPQYLPESHAIEDLYKIASHGTWQSAYWVKVPLFYYKKLLHKLVLDYAAEGNGTEARYFWKHGIFFLKNDLRVLVKGLYPCEEESEGILHIGAEQSSTGDHLTIQREIFDKIKALLFQQDSGNMPDSKKHFNSPPIEKGDDWQAAIESNINKRHQLLEVSIDGEYFVKYGTLRQQANSDEIRIEAKSCTDETQKVLIRQFEALLDTPPKRAKKVFVSYSHSNTPWLGRLRNHLAGLRRSNYIETWDDQEILPGDEWDKSIKTKLAEADVFILLLSSDFIASDYIWNVELQTAIKKYREDGNKRVIPVLVEPLDLGGLPGIEEQEEEGKIQLSIQSFEIVPKNDDGRLQAISLWSNQEEALAKTAERIRLAVRS